MRKILFSDVDETLYFGDREDNKISIEDQEAIKKFQETGHLFGVCTGRSYSGTMAALNYGSLDLDFMILSSGAIIMVNQQIIKEKMLTKEILNTVMNSIDLNRSGIMASINGNSYFTDYLNFTFQGAKKISNINDISEDVFTNIAVTSKEVKVIIEAKEKLEEALGDQVEVNQNELSLDISPKNCDKGTAIKGLVEYLGISDENVYAIGDSYNDIPMFKAVKHSYTFNTSKELVKQAAVYRVDSLAECIEMILNSGTNNSPSL